MKISKKIHPCAVWATKLALTRPEDLSPSQQAELLAHLEKCPACSAIRLEYHLMDIRIRNYPNSERLRNLSPPQPIPEYEFHRLDLLLQRQEKRNHGIVLIVPGMLFLFLVLACLIPLLLHQQTGFNVAMVDSAGIVVPMYFIWNGIASVFSSLQPVTIEEVKHQRNNARRRRYQRALGEPLSPQYTLKTQKKPLLIGGCLTVSGGSILFYALKSIPVLAWGYILLISGVVCLIECILLLDALYLTPRQEKVLPVRNLEELSRLLVDGEMTAVKGSWGQTFEEETET
jgi:hypothetical protein